MEGLVEYGNLLKTYQVMGIKWFAEQGHQFILQRIDWSYLVETALVIPKAGCQVVWEGSGVSRFLPDWEKIFFVFLQ